MRPYRLADDARLQTDPRVLLLVALTAAFTGRIGDALEIGVRRVPEFRRRGAVGMLVPTLALMAAGKAWLGDHAGAFADAGEAAEVASDLGYAADASVAVEMLAWQLASRGLPDQADAALDQARALIEQAGTTTVAAHHAVTRAYCALCRGDPGEVVTLLEARLDLDGGVGSDGEPLGVAPLLVEAYVALGRTAEARSLTARYELATPPGARPLTVALVERCRLLTVGDDTAAAVALETAVAAHAEAADPFETARTRLLYGSRLRRAGQRIAAREELTKAADAFAAMDLTHWSAVAAGELAATGATARRRPTGANEPLTSQETRVALLVAEGLSNREIGASLFLSPRTVERHLGNVFRKRGFRSRSQLAAFFARSSGPDS